MRYSKQDARQAEAACLYAGLRMRRPLILLLLAIIVLVGTHRSAYADHRSFGSGTCWRSSYAVGLHRIDYEIAGSVPSSWIEYIRYTARTWNDVTTSSFLFQLNPPQSNEIQAVYWGLDADVAQTRRDSHDSNTLFAPIVTSLNRSYDIGTDSTHDYSLRNVMTHEFGHWLVLGDISTSGCSHVTMWYTAPPTYETKKISLESPDRSGISWQYP